MWTQDWDRLKKLLTEQDKDSRKVGDHLEMAYCLWEEQGSEAQVLIVYAFGDYRYILGSGKTEEEAIHKAIDNVVNDKEVTRFNRDPIPVTG